MVAQDCCFAMVVGVVWLVGADELYQICYPVAGEAADRHAMALCRTCRGSQKGVMMMVGVGAVCSCCSGDACLVGEAVGRLLSLVVGEVHFHCVDKGRMVWVC